MGRLAWGYNPGLPEDVTVAWGCRAIVTQDGGVDVPPDRQDAFGPEVERRVFLERLRVLVGGAPFVRARELLKSYEMRTREAREFVLYEANGIVVKANTNASHGYLYICAYPA